MLGHFIIIVYPNVRHLLSTYNTVKLGGLYNMYKYLIYYITLIYKMFDP